MDFRSLIRAIIAIHVRAQAEFRVAKGEYYAVVYCTSQTASKFAAQQIASKYRSPIANSLRREGNIKKAISAFGEVYNFGRDAVALPGSTYKQEADNEELPRTPASTPHPFLPRGEGNTVC